MEEVRFVKYEVQTPTNMSTYRDFATYEEAYAYMQHAVSHLQRSVWRLHCYDDGDDTRYVRQLLVAFK